MVPEESITQNEGYSYGKGILIKYKNIFFFIFFCLDNTERIPLPPAPYVNEFDPLRSESNEEFIARLKHMGKSKTLKIK
jgi:hypothetical protein